MHRTEVVYPITAARGIEIGEREWSDGPPSYTLRIMMSDGTVIDSASSSSRAAIGSIKGRVEAFIAGELATSSGTRTGA